MADAQLKVTLVRSVSGSKVKQRRTVEALGLKHRHHTVIKGDTPQIRGMIKKVEHLLQVETV
jgi:large subunit ribosomal protein L30